MPAVTRLLAEHRRRIGDFEAVDFVDEAEIARLRAALEVACPTEVRWNDWEYGSEVRELRALYEKAKTVQWNATTDLAWDTRVSKDDWIGPPGGSLMAFMTQRLGHDEATQKAAFFDEVNYQLSQILHGEQAALQICGQLTNLCPTTDEKYYAASQVADEARHMEVFARFLGEKMGTIYPISPMLKLLLDELLSAEGYAKKALGMQTLFEGVAMAVFGGLRRSMLNPLLVEMVRRVEVDESRHAAFGVLTMRRLLRDASEEMRAELEDWAFSILEALNAAQSLGMLRTLGPKYGIDAERLTRRLLSMDEWPAMNSGMYMHTVVPNLQRLGLITERTEAKYRALGMLYEPSRGGSA